MFVFHGDKNYSFRTASGWFLLAFMAGNINVGGFMACQTFVSHVTGFATLFGVALAKGQNEDAFAILSVPAFFLMGVILSAILVDRPLHMGRRPHFTTVMAAIALCLTAASFLGIIDFFGKFGDQSGFAKDYFLMALLCMACGLLNAAISTSSRSTVRLTHLTGLTTDLGVGVVRLFTVKSTLPEFHREIRTLLLRIGTIGSFVCGSAVGACLFLRVHYWGFLLPTAIALFALFEARRTRHEIVQSLGQQLR